MEKGSYSAICDVLIRNIICCVKGAIRIIGAEINSYLIQAIKQDVLNESQGRLIHEEALSLKAQSS
jgi:hypothetical protein